MINKKCTISIEIGIFCTFLKSCLPNSNHNKIIFLIYFLLMVIFGYLN
jgi:hypothetical protein